MKNKILLTLGVISLLCVFDTRSVIGSVEYNKDKQDISEYSQGNQELIGLDLGSILDQVQEKVKDIINNNGSKPNTQDPPDDSQEANTQDPPDDSQEANTQDPPDDSQPANTQDPPERSK